MQLTIIDIALTGENITSITKTLTRLMKLFSILHKMKTCERGTQKMARGNATGVTKAAIVANPVAVMTKVIASTATQEIIEEGMNIFFKDWCKMIVLQRVK
eukprot:m.195754 g.195754  ORF g.195754 m.195754 type:complete len:101 (+) comp15692_c0_seq14:2338-2640(+)